MKPVIAGIIIGSVLGTICSMYYFYSFWLPVTALAVFLSGAFASSYGCRAKPSLLVSAALMILYFCFFWMPPEFAVRTADTPEEHLHAGREIGRRAQIFGDRGREFEQYKLAAIGDHPEACYLLGYYYENGYRGIAKDQSKAIAFYRRAAELGHVAADNRLRNLPEKE
jgi:TPR repeat protein